MLGIKMCMCDVECSCEISQCLSGMYILCYPTCEFSIKIQYSCVGLFVVVHLTFPIEVVNANHILFQKSSVWMLGLLCLILSSQSHYVLGSLGLWQKHLEDKAFWKKTCNQHWPLVDQTDKVHKLMRSTLAVHNELSSFRNWFCNSASL